MWYLIFLVLFLSACQSTTIDRVRIPLSDVAIIKCEPKTHMDLFNEDRTHIFLHQSNCTGVYQGRTVSVQVSGDHVYIEK